VEAQPTIPTLGHWVGMDLVGFVKLERPPEVRRPILHKACMQ